MVRHLAALDGLLRLTLYEQHVFVPLYRQRGSSLLSIWKVLSMKSHPEVINNPKDLLALIIRNYY